MKIELTNSLPNLPCVHLNCFEKPEITASYECLWTVPRPLRGALIRYPREPFRVISYHSVLPFKVWRLTRRMLLFVHHSSACLASSSNPLRSYVFTPNNHFHLASFREPHCLTTEALSTFHNIPGQSFAFCYVQAGIEPATHRLEDDCSTK